MPRRRNRNALGLVALLALAATVPAVARLQLAWPTPNKAYLEGKPIEDYIQATVSGEPESGMFGCVRNNGYKFHEGLDLKPVSRDKNGEPADPVFATMDGIVKYVNLSPGDSSYGRYIVIEHGEATPSFCSLYAHLKSASVKAGDRVTRGQVIGMMGHSAGGYAIPKDRAHLHFELALEITTDFQRWYDAQKFGSPNKHGMHNGMNLMGIDPKDFFDQFRSKRINDFGDYLAMQPVAVKFRVGKTRIPDYVIRYPSLLKSPIPVGGLAGWEIEVLWTGLPVSLRPLTAAEATGLRPGEVEILDVNEELISHERAIHLVRKHGRHWTPSGDLTEVIGKLFGP